VKISPEERLAMESFAANLARQRKLLSQSQEELAEAVGFSARYIRKLEAGEVNVGLRTIARFAAYFQIPLQTLVRAAKLAPAKVGRPKGASRTLGGRSRVGRKRV
jgi:transcriptional regulator with XRE-family HTH domain